MSKQEISVVLASLERLAADSSSSDVKKMT